MKNRILLILEKRKSYGERLAAFIGRQEYSPFNTQIYLEHPVSDEKWKKADVVLITSSLTEVYGDKMEEDNVFILDESGQLSGEKERSVYKYQSAGVIYQRLMEFCVEKGSIYPNERRSGKQECVCVGMYRPVNSENSFMKGQDICRQKGKTGKLLYLNFESVTIFEKYMEGEKKQEGISEMIYYVKQRSGNLGMRIEMMAVKGQVDYLVSAVMPGEIWELDEDDWRFCLDVLCRETGYAHIVLDFGGVMPPEAVLEICDEWYAIGEVSSWSEQLTERFLEAAGKVTEGAFSEKVKRIEC